MNRRTPLSTCQIFELSHVSLIHLLILIDICQIAAFHENSQFNIYVMPTKKISKGASDITGLVIFENELFLRNEKLDSKSAKEAFILFLQYLESFGKKIILIAHNGFNYDMPLILRQMNTYELVKRFKKVVIGFADSLVIFRNVLPERREEKKKFNQTILAADYLGSIDTQSAHNTEYDVQVLHNLITTIKVTTDIIINQAIGVDQFIKKKQQTAEMKIRKIELKVLEEYVSPQIIGKINAANINLKTLEETFLKFGEHGIEMLMKEDVGGRPRVTKTKRIIDCILSYLKNTVTKKEK